jgi:hypothetical protein
MSASRLSDLHIQPSARDGVCEGPDQNYLWEVLF